LLPYGDFFKSDNSLIYGPILKNTGHAPLSGQDLLMSTLITPLLPTGVTHFFTWSTLLTKANMYNILSTIFGEKFMQNAGHYVLSFFMSYPKVSTV